jgi:ring-1,2-phenylacetyl-CoA epoxidase subunit PaaE
MAHFHALKVTDVRRETPDCVSVALAALNGSRSEFQYQPGQYLTFKTTINGEEVRRSYSLCSSPLEAELRVAIKQVPEGKFSTFANEQLQVGDTLESMEPMGKFTYPFEAGQARQYVAFAAGSGITPILSLLKTALLTEPDSRFTLIYGNRNTEHIIFREVLEALKNQFMGRLSLHYVLSREHPGSDLFFGRIDADKCGAFCRTLIQPLEADAFFLCGPEEMIFKVRDTLQGLGVEPKRIQFELFATPTELLGQKTASRPRPERQVQSRIQLTLDGNSMELELDSSGATILDAALKAGADLPFACKGGVCCTCKAKVLEGAVDMDVNYALEPEEVAEGYILTCQSHPRTDRVVISFDE